MAQNLKLSGPEDILQASVCTGDEYFTIRSAKLFRETVYTSSLYPDLLLHVAEVQDLEIQQNPASADQYLGIIAAPHQMIDAQRLWWEISISSQTADEAFARHQNLELGETLKWQPSKEIAPQVVEDIYGLCEDVIDRIDHVGLANKGLTVDLPSKATTMDASQSSYTTPLPGNFW